MARVLIVGCGCRGRALARRLAAEGYALRGTTRDPARRAGIEAAGAEAVIADPDRLGTILSRLAGVSAVCWLLGSAENAPDLHGARLRTLLERLVDTQVRGVVYEAGGSVDDGLLADGAAILREASLRWRIPAEVVKEDPSSHDEWLAAMTGAVGRVLDPSRGCAGGPKGAQ
jgi:NAD(P)-dependent dehydrogenase (short-subunit alcohol dehydrogenase family)